MAISANTLLDIQITLGIVLMFFGIKPGLTHLVLVAISAFLAHYSYSTEKLRGSSYANIAAAWGAIVPVAYLLLK